ncbi:substrate-binding domain-containing protein [Vibrio sp. St2]|uniref:substrate-binding domain-containing protein n=1 Tax=Vibrio sp. St2 TaxID=2853441 RepID=UPI00248E99FA|nr:substrate-binding domain-containing protein [Vibrio sp. St2]
MKLLKLSALLAPMLQLSNIAYASDTKDILLYTPWIEEPGTRIMVDKLKEVSWDNHWNVNLVSDPVELGESLYAKSKPSAIVVNADPSSIEEYLMIAKEQGVPVVGMDSAQSRYFVANITSDNTAMARETAAYLAKDMNFQGEVVMVSYRAYPPVYERELAAKQEFENHHQIRVHSTIEPDVAKSDYQAFKQKLAKVLTADSEGKIRGVWSAWDRPALVAAKAIDELGYSGRIKVVGIDGTAPALEALQSSNSFIATSAQDLEGIAQQVAQTVFQAMDEETIEQQRIELPAQLRTKLDLLEDLSI